MLKRFWEDWKKPKDPKPNFWTVDVDPIKFSEWGFSIELRRIFQDQLPSHWNLGILWVVIEIYCPRRYYWSILIPKLRIASDNLLEWSSCW